MLKWDAGQPLEIATGGLGAGDPSSVLRPIAKKLLPSPPRPAFPVNDNLIFFF